jgi:CRP-like cAMP-binding protein
MILIEKLLVLQGVDLFKETPEDILASIAINTQERRYQKDETIITKGEMGDTLYIVVEGEVKIDNGIEVVATLGKREVFGELTVLSPQPRVAHVIASKDCLLLVLHRRHVFEAMRRDFHLVQGIVSYLCNRIRSMAHTIETKSH